MPKRCLPVVGSIASSQCDEAATDALDYPEDEHWRPKTRADCAKVPRPCPYVACRYHLYIDVHPNTGNIKLNFPGREVWEIEHSCALDIADEGGLALEDVGAVCGLTRERIRQMTIHGMAILAKQLDRDDVL